MRRGRSRPRPLLISLCACLPPTAIEAYAVLAATTLRDHGRPWTRQVAPPGSLRGPGVLSITLDSHRDRRVTFDQD